jgi:hypothetical protein
MVHHLMIHIKYVLDIIYYLIYKVRTCFQKIINELLMLVIQDVYH